MQCLILLGACEILVLVFLSSCFCLLGISLPLSIFNENVKRGTQISKKGEAYTKVTYPKFKLGEEVVREVAVPPLMVSYTNML